METTILERLSTIENLLYTQKSVLTFDEAAKFTGLSKSYLYKLTSTGKIAFYKPHGKLIYFEKVELEKWLLQNRVTPADELEQQATSYVSLGKKGGVK